MAKSVPMIKALTSDECDRMRLFLSSLCKAWDAGNRDIAKFFCDYKEATGVGKRKPQRKVDAQQCRELRAQGLTWHQVAQKLGVCDETARSNALGIKYWKKVKI